MKTLLSITLMLTIASGMAVAQNVISIQGGKTASGDTGTIAVMMKNDVSVNGLNFLLRYNPDIIKHLRITPAGNAALLNGSATALVGDDIMSFLVYGTGSEMIPPDSGRIFEIRYNVADSLYDSTSVSFVFTEGKAADSAIHAIPFEYVGGVVQITPALGIGAENPDLPRTYSLEQNYPNPFNPATTIRYQLPVVSNVRLTIYNLLGQVVTRLGDEIQQAGYKSVVWNAAGFASGVYFYRMDASSQANPDRRYTSVKKMMIVK